MSLVVGVGQRKDWFRTGGYLADGWRVEEEGVERRMGKERWVLDLGRGDRKGGFYAWESDEVR